MVADDSPVSEGAGQWTVAEGGEPGRPVLIRVRTDLDPAVTRPRWSHRLAVVWTFPLEGSEGQHGLPTSDQQAAMTRLEQALAIGLEDPGVAVLTSIATSCGQREWIWYCRPAAELNPAFNAALKGHPRYPLQLHLTADPAWGGYQRLLAAIGRGTV
jgi:hypothetical protein